MARAPVVNSRSANPYGPTYEDMIRQWRIETGQISEDDKGDPALGTTYRTATDLEYGDQINDPSDFFAGDQQSKARDSLILDRSLARPNEGWLIEIGNPHNPRLRREWERREGRPWPRDPVTGERYHVAHKRAIADGGTNTLDNIEPMHPNDHRAQHIENGDLARWARRAGIARAYGGTVEKPSPAPRLAPPSRPAPTARTLQPVPLSKKPATAGRLRPVPSPKGPPLARALPWLGVVSGITGLLSGRIRTDSFDNFANDMIGMPSEEDKRRAYEQYQRTIHPGWKPGDGDWV